jgi:hypothetical protein
MIAIDYYDSNSQKISYNYSKKHLLSLPRSRMVWRYVFRATDLENNGGDDWFDYRARISYAGTNFMRATCFCIKYHGARSDQRLSIACHSDGIPWLDFKLSYIIT